MIYRGNAIRLVQKDVLGGVPGHCYWLWRMKSPFEYVKTTP